MSAVVELKRKSQAAIVGGHPWIFSGAIHGESGVEATTTRVVLRSGAGEVIGHGFYSPQSQIRVRMYERTKAEELEPMGPSFFASRIAAARQRRRRLGLPSEETTGFRVVNSEGDGLPGLVVDLWGGLLVFQITTWPLMELREHLVEGLREAFADVDGLGILEAPAPKAMAQREGFVPSGGWVGEPRPGEEVFREDGVLFAVDPETYQKTGHYADMRPHRRWIARISEGARVFDGYSYTGAFGLQAARAGARQVVCVDSSAAAIAGVARNAELNGVADRVEGVVAKVDDALRSAYDRGQRFDLIVLDPPKLAPRRKHVAKAMKVYESLVVQAARLLDEGGILAVGSCSEAIGPDELERVLTTATARDARSFSVVYVGSQAEDHPVAAGMSEGRYLSFVAGQLVRAPTL